MIFGCTSIRSRRKKVHDVYFSYSPSLSLFSLLFSERNRPGRVSCAFYFVGQGSEIHRLEEEEEEKREPKLWRRVQLYHEGSLDVVSGSFVLEYCYFVKSGTAFN